MNFNRDQDINFSIHACDRCRKRKAKCDPGIPSCQGCRVAGIVCASTVAKTRQTVPRFQIAQLEHDVHQLEEQLRQLGIDTDSTPGDLHNNNNRSLSASGRNSPQNEPLPDLIRVEPGGDGHFLGASSGLHLARSVFESARKNSAAFEDHDASAQSGASQESVTGERWKTDGNVASAAMALPSRETSTRLIDVFFRHYEVQYPILEREQFMRAVSELYVGDEPVERNTSNPWTLFMLNMVISISLALHEDSDSMRLSDQFCRNATGRLRSVLQTKSHETLQCLLLLLLSSTLGTLSTPMWYVSGICMRMCIDLGYHTEKAIRYMAGGPERGDDPDTKRRLFWVTYTFDRSLAKMLGRPFFIDDGKIDVQFPISSIPEHARLSIHHWLTMQRIQSEIVSNVYVMDRPHSHAICLPPKSSDWAAQMQQRLIAWSETAKRLEFRGRYTAEWWDYWYQHARLMLNQPKSKGTKESLIEAFVAAETMVRLSFVRAHRSVSEFSWLDVHLHLVSGLTLLFLVLKSSELRERAQTDWLRFKGCVIEWEAVLDKLSKRWSSMVKIRSVLGRLTDGLLDGIEHNKLPEGHNHRTQNSSRKQKQDVRLAMEELGAPIEPSRSSGRSQSSLQTRNLPRKRRRRVDGIDGAHAIAQYASPPTADPTTPSMQQQMLDHATEYSWLAGGEDATGGSDDITFPSVLGGELFTDINQLGSPLQLDFSLLHQSSHLSVDGGGDPFSFQWTEARLDTTLHDSMLNFRGAMDEESGASAHGTQADTQYQWQ